MIDTQRPARNSYDAIVDLAATEDRGPYAYVLVKYAYSIVDKSCRLADKEALFHDLRDPNLKPRFKPGTDFWNTKEATDFVVQGSAHAPGGKPVGQMEVSVQVGKTTKRVTVFGRRAVEWVNGAQPRIGPPERFTEIPLVYENAYGGLDWRVPVEEDDAMAPAAALDCDHPGVYPRNPFGKGYLVKPGAVPDMYMPHLEDPDDLLTADRLIIEDPQLWYQQPLPWCFDWVPPVTFPRYVYLQSGLDAWFPGPQDAEMPEVQRGYMVEDYRSMMADRTLERGPDPHFFQEGSHGLILEELTEGERVILKGMHPTEPTITFHLPDAPTLEIEIEGDRELVQTRLHSVVCRPAEKMVTMVYGGSRELPRMFIPGVHKHIPVSACVNGDEPIHYDAPPTLHELLAAAKLKENQS